MAPGVGTDASRASLTLKPATWSLAIAGAARRAVGIWFYASAGWPPNRPPSMLLLVMDSRGVTGRAAGAPKIPDA